MTALLERAITQARQLPEPAQNAVAAMILEELEDEMCWGSTFANSQDILAKLSEEALPVRMDIGSRSVERKIDEDFLIRR